MSLCEYFNKAPPSKVNYTTGKILANMNSRTKNIYFQPRYESDAQYEQNVVKNLITVLNRVDNTITESFLKDLLPVSWIEQGEQITRYEYDVEVKPNENPEYDDAYVVGLSNYRTELAEVEDDDKDSRADGQITAVNQDGEKVFSVIIEAKTGTDTLSAEQLSRYKKHFDASGFTTAEWAAIHGMFKDFEAGDTVDDFLIKQYTEFLKNEEMDGVVAESTHYDDSGNSTQVNQILIRYEAGQDGNPYALRFLSWYRETADEDFELNYSAWFSAEDFQRLFRQIEEDTRRQAFVGVENSDGDIEPSLDPLIEWAENGGYGPSEKQSEFKGSHRRVVAEIEDRNGNYPELRLHDRESLRFSRLTENNSPNIRKPTHYEENEFKRLLSQLDPELREALFVDFELQPLWDHYIRRSLNNTETPQKASKSV